jgi:hypothetical protein
MKTSHVTNHSSPAKSKISQEEIMAKVEAKFGKKAGQKAKSEDKDAAPAPKSDSIEISKSAKIKKSIDDKDVVIGDIGKNDPKEEITKEKLKGLIKSGGFSFSDKEREALGEILK